jgi:hypothetical protein
MFRKHIRRIDLCSSFHQRAEPSRRRSWEITVALLSQLLQVLLGARRLHIDSLPLQRAGQLRNCDVPDLVLRLM